MADRIQVALLGTAICNNMAIDLGYGKHVWQIPFQNLNDMYLIGQISITLTICAAAWSKTVSVKLEFLFLFLGCLESQRVLEPPETALPKD